MSTIKNTHVKIKFGELSIGDRFECYGDIHLNYNYPKICLCKKLKRDLAEEIDGIAFLMNDSDEVFAIPS